MFFPKDIDEEQVMHSKGGSIEIVFYDDVNEVIKDVLSFFFSRYQIGLETSMRVNYSVFDGVSLLYYKYYKNF